MTTVIPAAWFWNLGVHVFPTHNKVPSVPKGTSWKDYRCQPGAAARFREYGVPLGLFAVADSDTAATEAWSAAHLPATPFIVTTGPYHDGSPGRGRHRYYRLGFDAPKFIHRSGHTIEFKHAGQYVVGPGSRRPDGVVYTATQWSWRIEDVPVFPADFRFDDGSCGISTSTPGMPYEIPEDAVYAGQRHYELFRFLRHAKSFADGKAQARELVSRFNQQRCRPPLPEDRAFENWFDRAWTQRDRPLAQKDPFATDLETSWR